MNVHEAAEKAIDETDSLVDALVNIAVWESERAIQQAKKFFETGEKTTGDGKEWDTCFKVCFQEVMKRYPRSNADDLLCCVMNYPRGNLPADLVDSIIARLTEAGYSNEDYALKIENLGHGRCQDCVWFKVPEGCNVIRDSEGCKRNKRSRLFSKE